MYFYMPTKVYSEKNCIANHKEELASLGKKALIVCGQHSAEKNGSLGDVKNALEELGCGYAVFREIEENPSVATIMKAREFGLKEKADFVIGIGGGSPMDAAKAIAVMMRYPEKDESFLYSETGMQALPVVAIPTTCGTGSETTPYAILTLHEQRTKAGISHRIFPVLALADATYLEFMPQKVLISTAVDALGHFIESWINVNATDYSRMLCREGMRIWVSGKEGLRGKPSGEDYENFMNASSIAGMAISHTGTSLPHGLSYYLTYEDGIPHGAAVGKFLPAYLREAGAMDREEILRILGFADCKAFQDYLDKILGEIPADERRKALSVEGMQKNKAKLANCPYPVDEQVLHRLFEKC